MNALLRWLAAGLAITPVAAIVPLNAVFKGLVDPATGAWRSRLSTQPGATWTAHNFSVPVDHFHNESTYEPHSDALFSLAYWLDDSYYQTGGPVIVLASGEFPGVGRIPYLEHGIAHILAKATGGLAVLLEHRYYGTSYPVPNVTLESLRFLSTEQAMADTAYFARNIKFPGLEHLDLTAPGTPWIIYGGSYAGAFAAFMRKMYPEEFWGGISASGVPQAIINYWEYFEAARVYAPGECSPVTQKLTHVVDTALFSEDKARNRQMKDLFGLGELADADFGSAISRGISGLQSTMWDPEIDLYDFGHYCGAITSETLLYASTWHLVPTVRKFVAAAGYVDEVEQLTTQMTNYIGYVRSYVRADLQGSCKGRSKLQCYAKEDEMDRVDFGSGWIRSWTYQTCTQWGYFETGSGVPSDRLPLISRAVTLEHATYYCRHAFNISTPPNVNAINKMGGFELSYPRLAFIDGAQDPWRQAGPHRMGLKGRTSTTSEPFILVDWGVHHWEEYGVANETEAEEQPDYPPKQVVHTQQQEVEFVMAWLDEFAEMKRKRNGEQQPGEL